MNVSKSLLFGYNELKTSNIKSYLLDTELLLSEALNCTREKIILNPTEKLVPNELMDKDLPGYAWDLLPYKKIRCVDFRCKSPLKQRVLVWILLKS